MASITTSGDVGPVKEEVGPGTRDGLAGTRVGLLTTLFTVAGVGCASMGLSVDAVGRVGSGFVIADESSTIESSLVWCVDSEVSAGELDCEEPDCPVVVVSAQDVTSAAASRLRDASTHLILFLSGEFEFLMLNLAISAFRQSHLAALSSVCGVRHYGRIGVCRH